MLNYNLKGTGFDITDEIRSYLEKKLAHAERLLQNDPSVHIDVELQHLPEGRSGKYRTEFTVASVGTVYRVERWGSTLHESIDVAVDDLQHELSRSKKKQQHLLRRSAARLKDYLRGWRSNP